MDLAGLPARLKNFRDANLDAKDHTGNGISLAELRTRLENQLRAETVLDAPMGTTAMAATSASKLGEDSMQEVVLKLSNQIEEMRSQINGGSSNEKSGCNHCKSKGYKYWQYHTEKDCWKLHPEKNKYTNKKGNADTGDAITDNYLFL